MKIHQLEEVITRILEITNKENFQPKLANYHNAVVNITSSMQQQASVTNEKDQNRQKFVNTLKTTSAELINVINTIADIVKAYQTKNTDAGYEAAYNTLNINKLFSYSGAEVIKGITDYLARPNASGAEDINKPQELRNEISTYFSRYQNFANFTNTFIRLQLEDKYRIEENLIEISFQGDASIIGLNDLSRESAKWNQVIIAFAMLTNESESKAKVEYAEKGSLILVLSSIAAIATTIAFVSVKILEVVKKYLEIKKTLLSFQELGLKKVSQNVEKASEGFKMDVDQISDEITEYIIDIKGNKDAENINEIRNAVRFAVRYMIKFVIKGGQVDVKLLEKNTENQEITVKLDENNLQMKKIELAIKAITGGQEMLKLMTGIEDEKDDSEVEEKSKANEGKED
jgi:septum formation topological specificity factor MinE